MSEKERSAYLPLIPERYVRPADVVPPLPSPVDAGGVAAATAEDPEATADQAEQERLTLLSRLGQDPTIRTTRNGVLVARFPLGVRDEADPTKTTWHQVLAFRQRAEQVRDTLKKGNAVEVIGYRHTREVPGRKGPRTVQEIYATVLKPRS